MADFGQDRAYEQANINYRFFLGWRHAALAGYFVVLIALISKATNLYEQDDELWRVVLLLCSPIGIALWLLDRRIRQLFRCAIQAGRALEDEAGVRGFFTSQESIGTLPGVHKNYPLISHSSVISILYLSTAAICGIGALIPQL